MLTQQPDFSCGNCPADETNPIEQNDTRSLLAQRVQFKISFCLSWVEALSCSNKSFAALELSYQTLPSLCSGNVSINVSLDRTQTIDCQLDMCSVVALRRVIEVILNRPVDLVAGTSSMRRQIRLLQQASGQLSGI